MGKGLAFWFVGLAVGSLALAETAKVELQGQIEVIRADASRQSYQRAGGSPITLLLEPKDQVCLRQGSARLTYGVKVFSLNTATPCFQVVPSPSRLQTLYKACQDIGVCKRQAAEVFAKDAKTKGDLSLEAPALYLPGDYNLPSLSLPIAGGSLPKTLRLLDSSAGELYRQEIGKEAPFVLPAEQLRKAEQIEVRSASGTLLYRARVLRVSFDAPTGAKSLRERALVLFATGVVNYAPAAYSYLLAAGETELAGVLEPQIRAVFKGGK